MGSEDCEATIMCHIRMIVNTKNCRMMAWPSNKGHKIKRARDDFRDGLGLG